MTILIIILIISFILVLFMIWDTKRDIQKDIPGFITYDGVSYYTNVNSVIKTQNKACEKYVEGDESKESLEKITESALFYLDFTQENPYPVLERLYEGVRESNRRNYTREGEKYIEVDSTKNLVLRLKHLAGHSIAWIKKLEESKHDK
jgi:hypothetical protein